MASTPDFGCHKCGAKESVWIMPTSGGRGTGETTAYGAYCNACKRTLLAELPSNGDGKKATAAREFKRFQDAAIAKGESNARNK